MSAVSTQFYLTYGFLSFRQIHGAQLKLISNLEKYNPVQKLENISSEARKYFIGQFQLYEILIAAQVSI